MLMPGVTRKGEGPRGGGKPVAALADVGQDLGPGGRGDVVDGVGPCDIYTNMITFTFSRRSWAGAAVQRRVFLGRRAEPTHPPQTLYEWKRVATVCFKLFRDDIDATRLLTGLRFEKVFV